MKKLPELDVDCNELYATLHTPLRSKLLLAAIKLNIFDELSEPISAEAVAQAIAAHPGNTGLFLDALIEVRLEN